MGTLLDRAMLLETIQTAYDRLDATLANLSDEQLTRTGSGGGEWTVKDTLAHLAWWEHYTVRRLNGAPRLIQDDDDGGTTLDDTNNHVYEENRQKPLAAVLSEFRDAFQQIRAEVEALPDERLADEDTQGLIAGNTYDHYDEHLQTIRAANGLA
ncbi:MAG: DinB family protein [Ktedonobacterales bacterium]